MRFLSPAQLWFLVLLPVVAVLYVWLQGRRKRSALSYPQLALVRQALASTGWRRHVPPAFMLMAIATMILAGARPVVDMMVPTARKTIVLAMDVSGSMQATDVHPSRLAAAQAAAKEFISKLPEGVRVALVAYAGSAHLVQAPTRNRSQIVAAIDAFKLERATAIGNAIIVSLGAIFPAEGIDVWNFGTNQGKRADLGDDDLLRRPVPVGSYDAAAIVLLSDGQNTSGIDPIEAAKFAAERGVRVYTVGFGTHQGAVISAFGLNVRVQLDEEALKSVAGLTGATYHRAADQLELEAVYEALKAEITMERAEREITNLFANAATLLTLFALALSVLWFGRVI
ncbi:VWA domain-containing protein [Caenimonas sedimenti]|uniref:VWA domain-containing protein n=2 Tax=Caenimonas sedimenti TaxID=2596921 RepID=A0A562ZIH7_9BURK|nr:VWA domain-containing protein [Caenimonas sedimenti]TWO68118.1 VWA domain-containing protein [Caenimonas sedimenti]